MKERENNDGDNDAKQIDMDSVITKQQKMLHYICVMFVKKREAERIRRTEDS